MWTNLFEGQLIRVRWFVFTGKDSRTAPAFIFERRSGRYLEIYFSSERYLETFKSVIKEAEKQAQARNVIARHAYQEVFKGESHQAADAKARLYDPEITALLDEVLWIDRLQLHTEAF